MHNIWNTVPVGYVAIDIKWNVAVFLVHLILKLCSYVFLPIHNVVVDMIHALLLNRSGLTWVILFCWDFVTTRYSTLNLSKTIYAISIGLNFLLYGTAHERNCTVFRICLLSAKCFCTIWRVTSHLAPNCLLVASTRSQKQCIFLCFFNFVFFFLWG